MAERSPPLGLDRVDEVHGGAYLASSSGNVDAAFLEESRFSSGHQIPDVEPAGDDDEDVTHTDVDSDKDQVKVERQKMDPMTMAMHIFKLSPVPIWLLALWYLAAGKTHKDSDDDFIKFDESATQKISKDEMNINVVTLCFDCDTLEKRFKRRTAALLCKRIALLAGALMLYVPGVCLVSATVETPNYFGYIPNPSLSLSTTSPAALLYNCTSVLLILVCAVMTYCTLLWQGMRNLKSLEILIMTWLVLILIMQALFFCRWFVARMSKEVPDEIFHSYGYDGNYTGFMTFLILYLGSFTPLRLVVLGPFFVFVPTLYATLSFLFGSPHQLQTTVRGIAIQRKEDFAMQWESVRSLVVIMVFTTVAKYLNEYEQRSNFLRLHNSFMTIQELSGESEDQTETGESPIVQVRSALASASTTLGVMSETPGVKALVGMSVEHITAQVDFARQQLQNANKLFEVRAEDLLKGGEYKDNEDFKAFLNQDCATFAKDGADDGMNTAKSQGVAKLARHAVLIDKVVDSVKVKTAAELAHDWGEVWGWEALVLGRKTHNAALLHAGERAFVDLGHGQALACDSDVTRAFMRSLHNRYLPNSYHNEAHAAQVSHFAIWLAKKTGWLAKADGFQVAALMVAAFGHDVGHFGRTNLYCAKTGHALSLIWNDRSVLENMHSATTFSLMKGEANILECMEGSHKARFRNNVLRFILATDVKEHFSAMSKLKGMMEDETFLIEQPNADEKAKAKFEEDIVVAGETLMRTSDIAHCVLPWEQHKEWSYRVCCEFFEQGDEETEMGVPVSPLCERKGFKIAAGQCFFIDHFGKGLLDVLVEFSKLERGAPGKAELEKVIQNGEKNKTEWKTFEQNFQPDTLCMEEVNKFFGHGEHEIEVVYPYKYEKTMVKPPVPTSDNLLDIARCDTMARSATH